LGDGEVVILDAGTGIRQLGIDLVQAEVRRIHLLLTHLHVDHVEGLGVFAPIWSAETELHLWGPSSPISSLADRLATYFSPPLFPVNLSEVPARVEFHDASETEWQIGGARLTSHAIVHPGPTVGYRIEEDGVALAYLTDHEPALGVDLHTMPVEWISGAALAFQASLLIHDCQYTPEEYEQKVGWGHSTTEHLASFAAKTEAQRVLLYHHDPMHTDEQLEEMREDVIRRWGVAEERCAVAAEGAIFQL
jgi:phosphoribosyl 1,2-cyclic phosphodiesterase